MIQYSQYGNTKYNYEMSGSSTCGCDMIYKCSKNMKYEKKTHEDTICSVFIRVNICNLGL